jgi:hypothetical protein
MDRKQEHRLAQLEQGQHEIRGEIEGQGGMLRPCLFEQASERSAARMATMDALNARFGRGTVFLAATGIARGWKLRAEHHSPCYTTRLAEVPRVRAV